MRPDTPDEYKCPECGGRHIKIEATTTINIYYGPNGFIDYDLDGVFDCATEKDEDFVKCQHEECQHEGNVSDFRKALAEVKAENTST